MNDELERARREQQEAEERLNTLFEAAGEKLNERMAEDDELRKLAYTMLFSNRLFNWAISEVSSLSGVTNEMVQIMIRAQQEKAQEAFDFAEMIKDYQDKQMPWLESKRREAIARKTTRERRLKKMAQRVRRKNIELPCHSMEVLFENNFTHGDMFIVMGERRAVVPILQLCARKYTKAGGHVALLSSNEVVEPNEQLARHVIPPQIWRNAATIYGDLKELLSPLSKGVNPLGLLVVEDLDNMLLMTPVARDRMTYLLRSYGLLAQYQAEFGGAMILGVLTDNDPLGIDRIQLYPAELLAKHVHVSWQEPKVSNIPSIVVGNDILLLSDIEKELATPE